MRRFLALKNILYLSKMKKILLLLLIIPLASASQIINKTMYFDGLDREYIIYIPLSYDGSQDVPLLFSFHGGSGYANDFMQMIKMNDITKLLTNNLYMQKLVFQ